MNTAVKQRRDRVGAACGGRVSWWRLLLMLIVCPIMGVGAGWLMLVVLSYYYPLMMLPMVIGAMIGGAIFGLMRLVQIGHRPTVWLGAVLAVGFAIVGQHYIAYLEFRERRVGDAREQPDEEAADESEESIPGLLEFLEHEARQGRLMERGRWAKGWVTWAAWVGDAVMMMAGALAVVIPASRQPFCRQCRTWLVASRKGRVGTAERQQLAELVGMTLPDGVLDDRFRVLNCACGCSPTVLKLVFWNRDGKPLRRKAWLDPEERDRLTRVLDEIEAS